MEALEKLLADARKVLGQYEDAEREARGQLAQIVEGRLIQSGAVRGVEMAIQAMRPDKVSRPDGAGEQA